MYTILSGETEEILNNVMKRLSMELVSDPGHMLNILAHSKTHGTAVGIKAPTLGTGIYVTAVEDILIGDEITIILKSYDVTGYMFETNKLKLWEIASVFPFKSAFENPYMRNINQTEKA